MKKRLIGASMAAALALSVLGGNALAAPPGSEPYSDFGAGMHEDEVVHIEMGGDTGFHYNYDSDVEVYDGDQWCQFHIESESEPVEWTNDGSSTLRLFLGSRAYSCEDGSEATIEIEAIWEFSGKSRPFHQKEQGRQCKAKVLTDQDPTMTFEASGDVNVNSAPSSGHYRQQIGTCHQTGTPGKPQG